MAKDKRATVCNEGMCKREFNISDFTSYTYCNKSIFHVCETIPVTLAFPKHGDVFTIHAAQCIFIYDGITYFKLLMYFPKEQLHYVFVATTHRYT